MAPALGSPQVPPQFLVQAPAPPAPPPEARFYPATFMADWGLAAPSTAWTIPDLDLLMLQTGYYTPEADG